MKRFLYIALLTLFSFFSYSQNEVLQTVNTFLTSEGNLIQINQPESAVVVFCAEYQAVYDAYTTKPSMATAIIWNTFVETLVSSGEWTLFDILYVFAAHINSDGEALINWMLPGTYNATFVNPDATEFTANEGLQGNGTNQYINLNWNPNTNGVNYVLNSASLGIYSRSNIAEDKIDMGNYMSAASTSYIISRWSNDNFYPGVNQSIGSSPSTASLDSRGLFISNRTASNVLEGYWNTTKVFNDNTASSAVQSLNFFVMARNAGGSPTFFTTKQLSFSFAASGLTQTNVTNIYNAFQTAMTSLGTEVSFNKIDDFSNWCYNDTTVVKELYNFDNDLKIAA